MALDQFPWPVADESGAHHLRFRVAAVGVVVGQAGKYLPLQLPFFFLNEIILLLAMAMGAKPHHANPRYIYCITLFIALFIGAGTQASLQRGTQLLWV